MGHPNSSGLGHCAEVCWNLHMEKLLYTVREVQDLLPISTTALYRAIQKGDIESHKVGRRRVFTGQALINYVTTVIGPAAKRGAR
jgi:excisionase family DNA binding protein